MKFRNIIILLLLSSVVSGTLFYGCIRKKEDFIGPEYLSAPADFSASNLSVTPSVNFTTGVCTITADFSARVTYYVTITGLSSGAEKKFTGVNNMLDAASPGGTWNGSHDGLYFFRAGEQVNVKITFLRSDVFIEQTITLVAVRNLFSSNSNLLPIGPINNVSYESANVYPGSFPFQFAFTEAIANTDRVYERVLAANYNLKAIHGLNVLRLSGKAAAADGYFVGGIQHRQGMQLTANNFLTPSSWTNPKELYFNVYIYGVEGGNALVNLEFHESDASNSQNDNVLPKDTIKRECGGQELNKYGHDPCSDDGWVYPVTINFTGWKLISVKFSDFQKSGSGPNGGNGNGIREPTRIARAQMGLVSTPAFQTAAVMFDYPVMSYGAPFDPTK